MQKTFTERVYDVVASIPKGRVASYGEVARLAGSPRASRAVGSLMNKNRDFRSVPCHRVILGNRTMGEYNGGPNAKAKKLQAEGIIIENGKVLEEQML